MIPLLLACAGEAPSTPPIPTRTRPPEPLPACEKQPCVPDVAAATFLDEGYSGYLGHTLAAGTDRVYAAAPVYPTDVGGPDTKVHALALPDLAPDGAWIGSSLDLAGFAMDTADIDGDGVMELAVGRPGDMRPGRGSPVHILPAAVSGDLPIEEQALLTVFGDQEARPDGGDVALGWALVFAAGGEELWVSGMGRDARAGRVHAFATRMRGRRGEDAALRSIFSDGPLSYLAAWDGDLDGEEDLVISYGDGLAWFPAPWDGESVVDRSGGWTDPCLEVHCSYATALSTVGDLTGDGAEDLAFAAPDHPDPEERAGRAYLVDCPTSFGPADDIPRQIRGTELGDAMGFALAGADVDGDGQQDLVTTASGVYPSPQPGVLLVFRGPIPEGTLTEAQADARVFGEHGYDLFVRAIAPVDADGDALADLAVGAPGYPSGVGDGAVYLVTGASLFP